MAFAFYARRNCTREKQEWLERVVVHDAG